MPLKDVAARLAPWLDNFIRPTPLSDGERLRFRLVVAGLLFILMHSFVLILLSGPLPLRPAGRELLITFCLIAMSGCIAALGILRLSGNRSVCLHTFILALLAATIAISMQLGGIYSPAMPVMLVIPALATSMLGVRAGLFWGAVLILVIMGFYQIEGSGIKLPNVMHDINRNFGTALGLGTAVTVTTLIILFYEFTTEKLNQSLRAAHDDYLFQASHDPLTGIANRRDFIRIIDTMIEHSTEESRSFALLFFDLNHFKEANDQFGHSFGDKILQKVADRLRQQSRDTDYISRWGGDEFAMLMPGMNSETTVRKRINELLEALRKPMDIDGRRYTIDASIGHSMFPTDGTTQEALIQRADQEMYLRKHETRAR